MLTPTEIFPSMRNMKITIDEFCGQPEGSFKKFIEKKESFLRQLEQERKERIRKARKI